MRKLALIHLRLAGTEEYAFQRRDNKAPDSPNMLGLFGGHMEPGEEPLLAATRELSEETSLQVSQLILNHLLTVDIPADQGRVAAKAYLFGTDIKDATFEVYEGIGCEVYSREAILNRQDFAPTARYILERLTD